MERQAVANTSSLIFLAKLNLFSLAKNMFSQIIIPKQVINELFKKESEENIIIRNELQEFLKEIEINKVKEFPLDEGETAAISLCLHKNIRTFLSDDKKARKIARSFSLENIGIIGIILWNFNNNKLQKKEAIEIINKLIDKGYYISSSIYAKIMQLIQGTD